MPIYIQDIATVTPKHSFEQTFFRDKLKQCMVGRAATKRIIHSIYAHSGIQKRYSVVEDFRSHDQPRLFFLEDGTMAAPSTKIRNELYIRHAKKLFVDVAKQLLKDNSVVSKEDITHVITVSCTGFFAPEPAYEIVKQLDLNPSTERYHIGFMGCFAAFPALKMAQAFCRADPNATVLVVCVELCSLHWQTGEEVEQLISASLFADGGSGVIVSSKEPAPGKPVYRMEQFQTAIAADSEGDMAWSIGDTGFDMVLSTYVPDIIEANLAASIAPLLDAYKISLSDIPHWSVHPGGRAILDKIESSLHLEPWQIAPSRKVLLGYGNMSSATILFVLKELLSRKAEQAEERALALAFGPGLTIESALLTKLS